MNALTISLEPIIELTDEKLFQLCQQNRDLRFERGAQGDITIMAPEGSDTGMRNLGLGSSLWNWNQRKNLGVAFGSSAGFILPNGAMRSPDVSWIKKERWEALTPEQQSKFAPICPDFVIELMSPSDSLSLTQAKMQEYQDNGARLGWLINRRDRQVEIYRIGQPVEILQSPDFLSGEEVLPEFVLDLALIW
ncbi:Uma2 family endonuclease [Pseudanabaena sp. FACHB-1277]|jgi:Uma2 family endonuclease|uniref:Uma2 family endonuclease n=1 Tax=Pseudanabaena cinerea FACHB-1277 TaxID=2949581 RepID=A0A926UP39_9CYAN|nr:Uma2 family endonuclease [Pseudanabaena cinerea]MBD2148620.1 Uma2 family endonuclease [Pseudanabaena cinerea FACHB-1277]